MTMISSGVEISIAGGGGEMVRAYPLVVFFLFSSLSFFGFFVIMRYLFQGTKSLMQHEL